ncbi:ArnT family glycosyltransferase [Gemmatimonadota bacterium]
MHSFKNKQLVRYTLLAAVYLCLTLPFSGSVPLVDPDEGYYPETAREMIERGNWLDPVFNGEPRWGKPVGYYLLEVLSFKALGTSEFSARLPSLLAGLGFVLLTAALGGRLHSGRAGFYSGLFAASALQPVVYGRTAVPDMLLAFFICLALYGFVLWEQADNIGEKTQGRTALAMVYLGSALAFLVKGPLGVILPGITVAAYLILSRRLKKVLRLELWWGIPLFLLAAAPWFVYMYYLHGPAYLEEFFLHRNLQRYFTNRWAHPGPVYYYLPIIIIGAFPWSLALIGGIAQSLGQLWTNWKKTLTRKSFNNPELFLWCWFGAMLVFFSFSRSKLPNYVLPLYPAAAVLSGNFLAGMEKSPGRKKLLALVGGTALFALTVLATAIFLLPGKVAIPDTLVLASLAPLGLIPLGAIVFLFKNKLVIFWGCSVAAMALVFAMVSGIAMPRADRFTAIKTLSESRLHSLGDRERILCLEVWPPSLLFYTGREVLRFDPQRDRWDDFVKEGGRWVLTRERSMALLDSLMQGRAPAELHRTGDLVLVRLETAPGTAGSTPVDNY